MAAEDLFRQYAVRDPATGRYFMPFANTVSGMDFARRGTGFIGDGGQEAVPGSGQNDDPLRYQPTGKTYNSLQDYFDALDPSSGFYVTGTHPDGTPISPSGAQNALYHPNGTRGTYNNQPGYFFDPNTLRGLNPATTSGGKPNDTGLWQMLSMFLPLAGELTGVAATAGEGASAASASDAAAGTGAFGGSVPVAAGESGAAVGAAGGTVEGSEGNSTVTGSAARDTLAGSDPYGTGVDANGNPTGQYANGTSNSLNLGNSSLWGPVIGAAANIYSANKASKLQTEAGKEANATQLEMFDKARSDLQPWRTAGEGALDQLTHGIQPGGDLVRPFTMADFENDPVTKASFRYGLDEGTKGINRMFGARGMSKSGAAIKALDRFTTDYVGSKAGESYNRFTGNQGNVYNRLAGVAGTGQTAATQTANLGVTTGANIGNTNVGIANARGAASIATGNAISNAASNIGNAYQTQYYLDSLNNNRRPTNNYYYMG
jgi:hypothetical protein